MGENSVYTKSPARNVVNVTSETQRTLKVSLGEYKQVVKSGDYRKGIAVHAHESNEAKVRSSVSR